MEEEDKNIFSWELLFTATGISFLLFSGFLKLIGGEHIDLFFCVGAASFGIGMVPLIRRLILK